MRALLLLVCAPLAACAGAGSDVGCSAAGVSVAGRAQDDLVARAGEPGLACAVFQFADLFDARVVDDLSEPTLELSVTLPLGGDLHRLYPGHGGLTWRRDGRVCDAYGAALWLSPPPRWAVRLDAACADDGAPVVGVFSGVAP